MVRTKRSSWLVFVPMLGCWIVLLTGAAQAQTFQGSFAGTVTDTTGAVIPRALVTAAEQNTGLTRSAVTLADGSYEIVLLPPGTPFASTLIVTGNTDAIGLLKPSITVQWIRSVDSA
jgi:hypothetical protein